MKGAFVACYGSRPAAGQLERAVAAFRWHHGNVSMHEAGPVQAAVITDGREGPSFERDAENALLVYGEPPRPLRDLLRDGRRFAALELRGPALAAARDPLGLSPLFYRAFEGAVWFATEILPLVAIEPAAADLAALAAQAALVPDPALTGFEGVLRVLPGSVVAVGPDLTPRPTDYWQVERLFGSYRGGRAAAEEELRARLFTAVDRSLEPGTAILLSGGIDSTAITAAAAQLERDFSVVHVSFPALGDAAEEEHARRVADALHIGLDVVAGDLGPWDPENDLRTSVVPYLTPPALAADTALAHAAGSGARIAIDGNDGDGVLGYGGREWGELLLTGSIRRLANLARDHGAAHVVHRVANDLVPPSLRLRSLRRRPEPPVTYLRFIERYFDEPLRARMREVDHERWRSPFGEWRWRQLRQVLAVTTMRNEEHELRGARYGIEMRHPFADRELVEFLISLPVAIKSDPRVSKELLRSALAKTVPPGTLDRPDKSGYGDVMARRVDADRCLEWIRESGVRLPFVDYERLYEDAAVSGSVPVILMIFLARAHLFAATT